MTTLALGLSLFINQSDSLPMTSRTLAALQVLLLVLGFSAQGEECLVGDSKNLFYVKQLERASGDLVDLMEAEKSCQCSKPSGTPLGFDPAKTRDELTSITRGISKACIRLSLQNIERTGGQSVGCESSTSKPANMSTIPCVNDNLVDFISSAYRASMQCLGAEFPGFQEVDPRLIFMKTNVESAFQFFIRSKNGVGLGQLTSLGAGAVAIPGEPGYRYMARALESTSPHCRDLRSALLKPLLFTEDGSIRHCQLISVPDGVVRNIFLSLALYYHYYEGSSQSIQSYLRERGVENPTLARWLTLVSYSRSGSAESRNIAASLLYSFGSSHLTKMKENEIVAALIRRNAYVKEILNKMMLTLSLKGDPSAHLKSILNHSCFNEREEPKE